MSSQLTAAWVPDTISPEDCISWLGGDATNPTWDEYIKDFRDELVPALEAIKLCCVQNNLDLYGEDLNDGYFLLSDGRSITMSMRAWGDFRQAMEGKREGYMKYYT